MARMIRVISTSNIQASAQNGDSTRKIDLTPWDLQLLLVGYVQKGLLFHNPKSNIDKLIQRLKASLSSTLDFFPPLAGRLAVVEHGDDDTTTSSVSIICNNSGALFVHAVADDLTVADILRPIFIPQIVHSFFPLNGVRNSEGTVKPLLAVQVTELVDGIFIGCTMNHTVADGTSFWHFFNSWSEISREGKLSKPPLLDRWFPDGVDRDIRIPFMKETQNLDGYVDSKPQLERVFQFTKEKIAELKARANAMAGSTKISSLQAVLTHLWRAIVRNQGLHPQEVVNYKLLIGIRQRLRPPLSQSYFGNALQVGTVSMKAGELLEPEGLGKAALEMNKMVALHTEETFMSYFKCWAERPRLFRLGEVAGNALVTSSSPRFDVYGNDFGWGKPVAVRSGVANKTHGKVTVFPGKEEGSIDVEVCLSSQILEAMGKDSEFMEAASVTSCELIN